MYHLSSNTTNVKICKKLILLFLKYHHFNTEFTPSFVMLRFNIFPSHFRLDFSYYGLVNFYKKQKKNYPRFKQKTTCAKKRYFKLFI